MKTSFFLIAAWIIISISYTNCIYGQIEVNGTGKVKIGSGIGWPSNQAILEIMEQGRTTEARIFATSPNIARVWTINQMFSYGLGVDVEGIGHIYKDVNNPLIIMTFNHSGCFGINYSPGTNYKLYIGGSAWCSGMWVSGQPPMDSYNKINNPLDKILKTDGYYIPEQRVLDSMDISYYKGQYCFDSKNLSILFPELVNEVDDSGNYAINYNGMIPVLVEAIKEQQKIIDKLQNDLFIIKTIEDKNSLIDNSENRLFQNYPNPFSNDTYIEYEVGQNCNYAIINIYDLNGNQLRAIQLSEKGKSRIVIKAKDLTPGIYLYNLVVDNMIIDTKQMVILKD